MSPLRRLWNVVRRSRMDDDLRQELDTHVALIEDEERRQGVTAEQARRNARTRFGNPDAYRERALDAVIATWFEHAWRDLRYAVRTLRKSPGHVAVVVLCLGLGIGVNTTIFGLFNAALLTPPTGRDPDRLVQIEPGNSDQISYPNYKDLGRPAGFEDLALSGRVTLNLRSGDSLQSLTGLQVSANYFELLGVSAWRGRTFSATEESPEQPPARRGPGLRVFQATVSRCRGRRRPDTQPERGCIHRRRRSVRRPPTWHGPLRARPICADHPDRVGQVG